MRPFKVVLSLLFTLQCYASFPSHQRWVEDFEQAQEMANSQKRPLLIAFLGPGWCPYSDQIEEEVLSSDVFWSALKEEIIFLKVEIREGYEEDSIANQLKEKYRVESCPSFILIEPTGHEIAKIDQWPIDGGQFACSINDMIDDYTHMEDLTQKKSLCHLRLDEIKSLYAQAAKFADTTFKHALLEEGLKMDQSPFFLLEKYGHLLAVKGVQNKQSKALRNKIIARDIRNEQGCRRQIALMDFEALTNSPEVLKAKSVVKPLIDYLQKFGAKDIENAWQIEMKISKYLFSKDQVEEALKHANEALKLAPDSVKNEISKSVEYLKTESSKTLS